MASLADAGYEFAETEAGVLYPGLDDEAFGRARRELLAEALFPEVVRVPGLLTGTGGAEADLSLRKACRRAALVGAKVLVVTAPMDGADERHRVETWREAVQAVGSLGEHAARNGLSVAVGPGGEGSVAETLEEAWVLAEEVGHRAVGVAGDLGAMGEAADVAAAGSALRHVWMPLPRRYGGEAATTACLETLGDLVELGYDGRVSVFAKWSTFAERAGLLLDELKAYSKGR